MTYTIDEPTKRSLESFKQFDADTQLALLWHGYLDIKDHLNPAPPPADDSLSKTLYNRICALPKEQQLQTQREIINHADSEISRAYSALGSSGRIELWLLLGQGMEEGKIIPMPSDYKLPQQTQEFQNQIKSLDFEQRIDFMRRLVAETGAAAA